MVNAIFTVTQCVSLAGSICPKFVNSVLFVLFSPSCSCVRWLGWHQSSFITRVLVIQEVGMKEEKKEQGRQCHVMKVKLWMMP